MIVWRVGIFVGRVINFNFRVACGSSLLARPVTGTIFYWTRALVAVLLWEHPLKDGLLTIQNWISRFFLGFSSIYGKLKVVIALICVTVLQMVSREEIRQWIPLLNTKRTQPYFEVWSTLWIRSLSQNANSPNDHRFLQYRSKVWIRCSLGVKSGNDFYSLMQNGHNHISRYGLQCE